MCFFACLFVCLEHKRIVWLVSLVGWLVGWFCLFVWFVVCLFALLVGWLVGWFGWCAAVGLAGLCVWLVGWLVGWLFCLFIVLFVCLVG